MTETPNPPRVRITNPDEFAQIVPYLVGFTPEESLVIVVIDDHQVQVTARADLAEMQQSEVHPGSWRHQL